MAAEYEQKNSILDYHLSPQLSPRPHLHKELELIYIRKGFCRAIANRKEYLLTDGDIFLTFPYQVHYYLDSVQGEYYVHAFPSSVLTTMVDVINHHELMDNVFHINSCTITDDYFLKIRDASGPYANAERFAYIILIMSKLLPQCNLQSIVRSSSITIRNILEYCSTHFTENLSLDTLSSQLHLNKYYISHSLNQQINMRLNTFINSLRIDAACKMLQDSDKKIADIAQSVGYETIRSFNRAFMEIVSTTPREYRDKHLQMNANR